MRNDPRLVVLASAAVLITIAALVPPVITYDSAQQLKALLQYLNGESPSLNHLVQAGPSDLTSERQEWIVWWPPSTPALVLPFVAAGFALATGVRIVAAVAIAIGALGWLRWWSLFELPRGLLLAVAILLPWRRYAASNLFEYSGEVLVFAAVPWVLLGVHAIMRETSARPASATLAAFGVGLAAGALYLLKHSAVFVTVGVGVALALHRSRTAARRYQTVVVVAGGAAIPIAVLSLLNVQLGGAANMIDSAPVFHLSPWNALYAISNPALALADGGAFFTYVFTNQDRGIWQDPHIVGIVGIPGGLTIMWLAARAVTIAERIAVIVLAVSVALLLVVWTISYVTFEDRHLAGAAAAVAPAVVAIGLRRWQTWPPALKTWSVTAAAVYVIVPWALYSPVAVFTKVLRTAPYVATPSGLHTPRLSATNGRAAVSSVSRGCAVRPVVWYIPDIATALEFNGPVIVNEGLKPPGYLAVQHYRGPVAVCAVLPTSFESEGKGAIIRRSFHDIETWREVSIPESGVTLWVGQPAPDR